VRRWPLKPNSQMESASPDESSSASGAERLAVDSAFRSSADVRVALAENLKALRPESEAIAARVDSAFKEFDLNPASPRVEGSPSRSRHGLVAEFAAEAARAAGSRRGRRREGAQAQDESKAPEAADRNYVKQGTAVAETLDSVILDGIDALKSSDTQRTITFNNPADLESLSKGGSSVEPRKLLKLINEKSDGPSLLKAPAYAQCKAKLRATKILAEVATAHEAQAASADNGTPAETQEAAELVKGSVNLQMSSATSPEERLAYGSMPKIPNAANDDTTQKGILDTFELRPGPSDVTSYHDFRTLQIAFQHVWTRIYDGELEGLGRELYREYVKLKDFGGFTEADLKVRTADDLHNLIDEVRKLSQWVEADIPKNLGGSGADGGGSKGAGDWTIPDVASGGLTWLLRQALEALAQLDRKAIITWEQFPGPWGGRADTIEKSIVGGVAPDGFVEIVLETDEGSHVKILKLELFDEATQRYADGKSLDNRYGWTQTMAAPTSWMATSVLEFRSEETSQGDIRGRYVLAELSRLLVNRSRVTFHWKDS
jgi:hypothetical protein